MITYKPRKWKELMGTLKAKIVDVEVEKNNFFDPDKENSTENILNIYFEFEDPETLEPIPFTQKYIAPLIGGSGLFQQLLDVANILPNVDGGSLDEQSLVGLTLMVTLEKNKKGYSFIKDAQSWIENQSKNSIVENPNSKKTKAKSKEETQDEADLDDLPF
jgi:hypothetical protein